MRENEGTVEFGKLAWGVIFDFEANNCLEKVEHHK